MAGNGFVRREGEVGSRGNIDGSYGCRDFHLPEVGKGVERGNRVCRGGNCAWSGREGAGWRLKVMLIGGTPYQ